MSKGLGPVSHRQIKLRAVSPDQQGLDVENAFAGALAVGTLVYVSGVNTTSTDLDVLGKPKVTKADANATAPADRATYVVVEAIPQSGYGRVARAGLVINVDTSSYGAVGDPVYLSATAGESTPTAPAGTVQIVGYVKVKSATVGEIVYDLVSNPVTRFGSTDVTFADGSAALPSITFTLDTNTGWYRVGADTIGMAFGGAAGLAYGVSSPTLVAADNAAGQDVYVKTADGGATPTAQRDGGDYNLLSGAGSAALTTITAGTGGAQNRTAGAGGAKASGTSGNGGIGGAVADVSGAGGATAGTTTSAGGTGGAMSRTAGVGGAQTGAGSSGAAGTGGSITDAAGNGGAASGAGSTGNGGTGGSLTRTGGTGGATVGGTAGAGGAITDTAGAGAAQAIAVAGGTGGNVTQAAGAGGANTGGAAGEAGGAGGAAGYAGGAGGATNSTGAHTGGAGGAWTGTGGAGGAQTGAVQAGGDGGIGRVRGGAGGASTTGTGGAGGAGSTVGGVGGAGATGGAGGQANVTGGAGGAGTTGGVGGDVNITAGAAGAGGNVAGGAVIIGGGAGTGTGNKGIVQVAGLRQVAGVTSQAAALAAATELKIADSGGLFAIDQDSAFDIDLPSPTPGAGLCFDFVITDAGASNVTITVLGGAATFVGTIVNDITSVLPCTGATITFVGGTADVGDNVYIRSISTTLYFARAVCSANGGITIT